MANAKRKQWERLPSESPEAYRAFALYRDAGPGVRSIEHVAAKLRKGLRKGNGRATPGRLNAWSAAHSWVKRAGAFDEHIESIRLAAVEKATAERAKLWADRLDEIAETEWESASALMFKAIQLLEPDPQAPAALPPSPANVRTAAAALTVATSLRRRAAELGTGQSLEPQTGGPRFSANNSSEGPTEIHVYHRATEPPDSETPTDIADRPTPITLPVSPSTAPWPYSGTGTNGGIR